MHLEELVQKLPTNSHRHIARAITLVENEIGFYQTLLEQLHTKPTPILGFTGPPGAGKSTLVNKLIAKFLNNNNRVAVLAIDPTSPFNYGALLGDRIRMLEHFKNPNLYVRSIATRGSLGGLSDKVIDICEVLKASSFDIIIVETVGVGQSEVDIAGLADICTLVLVPEAGDQIQNMKSGIMEIADIFVVNKSDRDGADVFLNSLKNMLMYSERQATYPVIPVQAIHDLGIQELYDELCIQIQQFSTSLRPKKIRFLSQKVFQLIAKNRMKDISIEKIQEDISRVYNKEFNIYTYVKNY